MVIHDIGGWGSYRQSLIYGFLSCPPICQNYLRLIILLILLLTLFLNLPMLEVDELISLGLGGESKFSPANLLDIGPRLRVESAGADRSGAWS